MSHAVPTAACPRCGGDLETVSGAPLVLGCRPCESAFFDNAASQTLVDDRVPAALRQTYALVSGLAPQRASDTTSSAYRTPDAPDAPCPICRHTMMPIQSHGVSLDVCLAHGTWLDRGEADLLRKAHAFARASDEAREAQISSRREASIREVAENELRANQYTHLPEYERSFYAWLREIWNA
ncbi:MAG: zf-TFIIB domain-containing protein [Sandaracinaceae bacterium]